MYDISIIANNGSLMELCKIDEDNDSILNFKKSEVNNVNEINMLIIKFIKKSYSNNQQDEIYYKYNDTSTTCYQIIPYRKFKLFLFFQESNVGIRHLCYISNKIVHNSWGCSIPSKDSILNLMKIYYIKDSTILENKNNDEYKKQVSSIENNFGI
jgi:hypothetical protein